VPSHSGADMISLVSDSLERAVRFMVCQHLAPVPTFIYCKKIMTNNLHYSNSHVSNLQRVQRSCRPPILARDGGSRRSQHTLGNQIRRRDKIRVLGQVCYRCKKPEAQTPHLTLRCRKLDRERSSR
jgi:hypothetical protein